MITKSEEFNVGAPTFTLNPLEVNKRINNKEITTPRIPPNLLGIIFNTLYKYKKYHSGTIWEGVTNELMGIILIGWLKVSIVNKATETETVTKDNKEVKSLKMKYKKVILNWEEGEPETLTGTGDWDDIECK